MKVINKALDMIMQELKKEFGEDAQLEKGDEIVGVFNDGVINISMDDGGDLKINIIAGKPYVFDFNLNLLEKA